MEVGLFRLRVEGDKQPEYRGDLMTPQGLMEIAAWIKDGKSGKYMSLKVSPKREKAGTREYDNPRVHDDVAGPDIPF